MQKNEAGQEAAFRRLPKIELHLHLDGSIPFSAWRKMAVSYPGGEAALLKKLQAPVPCKDLAAYLGCFALPLVWLKDKDFLRLTALALMRELSEENVLYAELRFAPLPLCSKEVDGEAIVGCVLSAMEEGEKAYGVMARAILCAMRGAKDEENRQVLELAKAFMGKGVVAVDIAGDEARYPISLHASFMEQAVRWGIPYTLHAGETHNAQNIQGALDLGAKRIGHGVAAYQDTDLIARLANMGTLLEVCPISNWQTGAVTPFSDYPIPLFIQNGVNFCINTDNRTVSSTSLTKEYVFLAQHYDFINEKLLRQLNMAALEGAFLPEGEKRILRKKLQLHSPGVNSSITST